jgi:GWxTD domain-containing protein
MGAAATEIARGVRLLFVVMKCGLICGILFLAALPSPASAQAIQGKDSLLAKLSPREYPTYCELQMLMNPNQIREYLTLPNARERSKWIERFWVGLDPTPTTEANERRNEHERRVLLARERYASHKAPGWDSRGEVLIRYGVPAQVTKTDVDISPSSYMLSGETWHYVAPRMVVQFERNVAGEYVCSGDPVFWFDKGLYAVPAEPDYCADELINSQVAEMMNPFPRLEYNFVDMPMQENEIYRNLEKRPFVHSCDLKERIPCYFDVTTFRNADRSLRTEVNFEVPANKIGFFDREGSRVADVELRVLVRDSTMRKIAFAGDQIRVTASDSPPGSTLLPGQVTVHLKPGRYRIGLEAYDSHSRKRAAFTRNLEIAPESGSPRMSDILFASSIRNAEPGSKFAKGNLQVVPHPARVYRIPFPINFYFEIYGLDTDKEGKAFYRVEYRIIPLEKKRWGPVLQEAPVNVGSALETSGYGSTQPQRLSIATNELWEGPFRLEVTVTDRRTFKTAVQSAKFSIIK